jgi:hypothetical protein
MKGLPSKVRNNEKKGVTLSGLRVSEQEGEEFYRALKHYRVKQADFGRMVVTSLIEHYQAGDPLESVFSVPFPKEEAKNYRAALKHYRLGRRDFGRMVVASLIEHYQAGDALELPIAFEKKTRRQAN